MEDLLKFKVEQIYNKYLMKQNNLDGKISIKDILNEYDCYIRENDEEKDISILINKIIMRSLRGIIKKRDLLKLQTKIIATKVIKDNEDKIELNQSKTPSRRRSNKNIKIKKICSPLFKNNNINPKIDIIKNNSYIDVESEKEEYEMKNTNNFINKLNNIDIFMKKYNNLNKLEQNLNISYESKIILKAKKIPKPVLNNYCNFNDDFAYKFLLITNKKKIFYFLKENEKKNYKIKI